METATAKSSPTQDSCKTIDDLALVQLMLDCQSYLGIIHKIIYMFIQKHKRLCVWRGLEVEFAKSQ